MEAPAHRKRARLTLDEFRQHKEAGIGMRVMPKVLGVSKNHIQFLSALDQGKFAHLSKEQFQEDYLSGMSLFEIAEKYGVPKDYIGFLREHFDINRLGPKFINRKKTEKPLTQRQRELIYGSLMGDACRMSLSSIKMKQSVKQREYLLWKFNELSEHVPLNALKEDKSFDQRYDKYHHSVRFYTHANTEIEEIITQFYGSGKKVITQSILDQLTAFSVAVWFMDDGTTDFGARKVYNAQPVASLCTDSFTKEECELICSWLKEKWGIGCYTRQRDKSKPLWRVIFPTTETPKLFDLIRPYIVPSMLYKVV